MKNTGFTPATKRSIDARSGECCERCGLTRGTEYHHRRPRQSGGSKAPATNGMANALLICPPCHRDCESRREHAYRNGWLVHSWEVPDETRVVYRGYWALLSDDGDVHMFEEAED